MHIPVISSYSINLAIDYCATVLKPHSPLNPLPIPEVKIKIKTIPMVIKALKIWYLNWLKKYPFSVFLIE
jgi:hypothetical protein